MSDSLLKEDINRVSAHIAAHKPSYQDRDGWAIYWAVDRLLSLARDALPKTVRVPVWRVDWVVLGNGSMLASQPHRSYGAAEAHAKRLRARPDVHGCIEVAGPCYQTVPA